MREQQRECDIRIRAERLEMQIAKVVLDPLLAQISICASYIIGTDGYPRQRRTTQIRSKFLKHDFATRHTGCKPARAI